MAKDPAFLFYPSDFLTGTLFMNNEQIGIYIKLLCSQHQHGGIIDKNSFNYLVGENVLIKSKFIETETGYYNERLTSEMEKRNKKTNNMSEVAKLVWAKRKEENTIVLQKQNKSKAIVIQPVNVNEDIIVNNNELLIFENFRKEYLGTKLGNETEFKNFQKHYDWKTILPTLQNIIKLQIENRNAKKQRNEFVPDWKNLKTWINQRCWEEVIEENKTEFKPKYPRPDLSGLL